MNGMQGLFNVLGGGSMMGMQDFLSPEQQRAIQQQSMMAMAAKLLQAGGPSTTPTSLGQAIGGAFEAGQGAMQSGQTNAVQQMLLRQKLEEAKTDRERAAQLSSIFGAGAGAGAAVPVTPEAAINVPGAAVGPTATRAAAIGTMPAPMANDRSTQAARYRQAASLFAADPAKAKAYMDIADQLDPREKFSTTPQYGRSASGTPISYVLSESGGMKLLDVQQSPDFNYQDMGGYVSVRDKRTNSEVERIPKSMSPSEQANYGLRTRESDLIDTPEGYVRAPKFGGPAQPVVDAAGQPVRGTSSAKPPTEGQLTASGFANRMEASETIFSRIPADQVPRFGMSGQSSILSYFRSPEGQMAKQAADDWIRAKLRKESGAVIGEDEMMAEYKTYFPMPGDSAQVVAQKAQARQRATEAMKRNAGSAYTPYTPPPAATPIPGLGTGTMDLGNYFNSPRR
jgi:hypothetical protein